MTASESDLPIEPSADAAAPSPAEQSPSEPVASAAVPAEAEVEPDPPTEEQTTPSAEVPAEVAVVDEPAVVVSDASPDPDTSAPAGTPALADAAPGAEDAAPVVADSTPPVADTPVADTASAAEAAAASDVAPVAKTSTAGKTTVVGATATPDGEVKLTLGQIKRLQTGKAVTKRKKPSAAERHKGVFFARLNELRRAERQGGSADPAEAPDASAEAPVEAVAETAPVAEAGAPDPIVVVDAVPGQVSTKAAEPAPTPTEEAAPAADAAPEPASEAAPDTEAAPTVDGEPANEAAPIAEAADPAAEPAPARDTPAAETAEAPSPESRAPKKRTPPPPLTGTAGARVQVAITRVGGPEAITKALSPQPDASGEPMKWAAVCAERATGLTPGDPVFQAWLRLAATPVRDVKAQQRLLLGPDEREQRDRGRGGRPGGGRDGRPGGRDSRGGARDGARQGGGGRGGRDRGPSNAEFKALARDGSLSSKVRIVTGEDDARKERDAAKKAAKEAKRQAERERLARLGY